MQGSTESSQQGMAENPQNAFQALAQKTFTKKTSEPLALGLPVKGVGPHTHSALAPKAQKTGKQ